MIEQINLVDASDIECCDIVEEAIHQCDYDLSFSDGSCTPLMHFDFMREYDEICKELEAQPRYDNSLETYILISW